MAASLALLLAACSDSTPRCFVDHLAVAWAATIERGGAVTSGQLASAVTPLEVTPEVFDSLAKVLVDGEAQRNGVMWSVPAFDTDPGGIAVAHKAALARGEVLRVGGVLAGGGWGVTDSMPAGVLAQAGVEAGEFVASQVSGTIAVLETEPVALRLDLTARDSTGDSIRVRGDARFGKRRERGRCE